MSGFSRRDFLTALGLSTGGLVLTGSVTWAADEAPRALAPNVFVHIAEDGLVTIVCHRTEMGQGVRSTLPALIADELGADVSKIRVVQGDGDEKFGDQNTDGSSSVRKRYQDLRVAGATARVLLSTVAAKKWGVDVSTLTTEDGFILHPPTKKKAPFAEFVLEAAKLKPGKEPPKLKDRSQHKHIGTKNFTLLDGPDIVTGKAIFGSDVKLPGLLVAVVLHPPVAGGEIKHFDASAALKVPGVRQVIEIPAPSRPYKFKSLGGLAVVADNTWAAMRGRNALVVTWDSGDNHVYESNAYRAEQLKTVREPGVVVREVGKTDEALKSAARRIEAEYFMPHLAHAPMEPPTATAWFKEKEGTCEVWASTQNPQSAREEVADEVGLSKDKVTIHVTLVGGAFGRKSKADYVREAALVSKKAGAPIRLQWTREDDIQHDYFHTTNVQRLEAGLDADNKIVAWKHSTTFPPIAATFLHIITHGDVGKEVDQGLRDFPLTIPNVRVENGGSKAYTRIGWMRSVNNIHSSFGISSFIDELAVARKMDPKDNLLEILGPPRHVTTRELGAEPANYGQPLTDYPIDTGRMRACIERVCELSKWNERAKDSERGYGLAFHRSFQCSTAVVVAVKKKPDGKVKVDEVWLVADAGLVVNLERAHSQMEGAVLFGMSLALYSQITFKDGIAQQSNFHDYRLTRMPDAPRKIHVEMLQNEEKPGGIGEPGLPPVAPAIFNAVFALTGKRVRQSPLSREGIV